MAPPDKRIVDLQQRLSQMDVLGGEESAASFSARLSQLELEPESANRSMKLDGLLIDVASHVDALKVWSATVDKAQLLLAEAAMWSEAGNLSVLAVQLQVAVSERDLPRILALEPLVLAALDQTRQQAAADARRKAILSGLAELGYQVNESMSTSWVRDGRVVFKKSAHDQHGVEVASAADAQRLQVRTVALAESRTRSSDLAAETAWCGDFSKLQEHLKAQDGELDIEMAKGVGAVPLKVVLAPTVAEASAPAVSAPRRRQLR